MDLQERHQLDMAAQVARVRDRTRPWRSIIALVVAVAALVAVLAFGHPLLKDHSPASDAVGYQTGQIVTYAGAVAFFLTGLAAVFGLTGQLRDRVRPRIGSAHAGVLRYALVLIGVFLLLVVTLDLANIGVGQLVLGGAVTGVLLGIAAQQSLANLFAGLVLLFARPFRVGQRVRFRAGALGGTIEGDVTDISLTYVRVDTDDGVVLLPNSQVLASLIGAVPPAKPAAPPAEPAASSAEPAASSAEPAASSAEPAASSAEPAASSAEPAASVRHANDPGEAAMDSPGSAAGRPD
jgi:Mechanosensitive ion channel